MDPKLLERIERSTIVGLSADIAFVPRRPHFFGGSDSIYTSHSGPHDYLQRVPMVLYGPGYVRSQGEVSLDREVSLADIAPTIAELVDTPFSRAGRPLTEALLPASKRNGRPAVVAVVVWDGGGTNVLEQWPRSWPNLEKLMEEGTSVTDAVVGSSPSVTPSSHGTIGTGAFPKKHGLVDSYIRTESGVSRTWEERSPDAFQLPTLADLYDRREGNLPIVGVVSKISWHWGMIGQGAFFPGGDHDIAIEVNPEGVIETNPSYYSLPESAIEVPGFEEAIRTLDARDGAIDSHWFDASLDDKPSSSPAWTIYQTAIIERVLEDEGFGVDDVPDLFFTNFKDLDVAGHNFNMVNREVKDALEITDDQLPPLMETLDRVAGRGRWVMMLTADHGQQPSARSLDAWSIVPATLADRLAEHFDVATEDLVEQTRTTGFWLDRKVLKEAGGTMGDVADFFLDYTIGQSAPEDELGDFASRADEKLIEVALPASRIADALACARDRAARSEE